MIDDRIYKGKALLYEGIEFNEEVIFYCNDVGTSAIVLEFYKDLKTPYSLEGARVVVNIAKKDGNIVTDFMNITGENKAEYIYPINGLTAVGKSNCTILVYDDNGDRVTFGTFKFRVRADINGDVESTTEYPVLNKLISDVDVLNQDVNSAEALRIVEENHRKSNEVERKNNENDRVKTFNDIKNEYSSIKGIMIDENNAANLQNQINKTNSDLDNIVQQELTYKVNVKTFGAIGDGKSHKLSEFFSSLDEAKIIYPFIDTLNCEIDYCAIQKSLNEYNSSFVPQGTYLIDKPLKMRFNTIMYGVEIGTAFKVLNNIDTNSYLITYGDKYSYGDYNGVISNIFIYSENANSTCKGIYINSGITLTNVTCYELKTFLIKHSSYIDRITLNRCNVFYCSGTDSEYVINLSGDGDGLEVNNLHLISAYLESNYNEKSGILISRCKGGVFNSCIINSGITINLSNSIVFNALHSEGSQHELFKGSLHQIIINNSSVTINGLYKHKNLKACDIVLKALTGNDSHENSVLELNNCRFDIPGNLVGKLQDVCEIQKTKNTMLKISNCFKTFNFTSKWTTTNELLGIRIASNTFFNNNSQLLSIESVIDVNNNVKNFNLNKTADKITDAQFLYGSTNNPNLPWLLSSLEKCYYKIVLVHDIQRNIGKIISSESFVTPGENKGILLRLTNHTLQDCVGDTLVIYRGNTTNNYNKIFKVSAVSANYLFDFGTHISGFFSEINETNNIAEYNISDYFTYVNNGKNVEFEGSQPPTVGNFVKGDRCINKTIVGGGIKSWIYSGTEWLSEGTY